MDQMDARELFARKSRSLLSGSGFANLDPFTAKGNPLPFFRLTFGLKVFKFSQINYEANCFSFIARSGTIRAGWRRSRESGAWRRRWRPVERRGRTRGRGDRGPRTQGNNNWLGQFSSLWASVTFRKHVALKSLILSPGKRRSCRGWSEKEADHPESDAQARPRPHHGSQGRWDSPWCVQGIQVEGWVSKIKSRIRMTSCILITNIVQ